MTKYLVAVIGAGPAGLYAARELALAGAEVVLINRDIKPGGLAEYGIYHDKHKMKDGLRKQFRQILKTPGIQYYGNVSIGNDRDLTLNEVLGIGFQAVIVAAGAQGTKWLGLPGEDLQGVFHAKDIVYHYNKLPPFSSMAFPVYGRTALVGVGNVMMDVAHWAIRDIKVDEVIAIARRGPAEVKFTKKEMEAVGANLDVAALETEIDRVAPIMQAIGQDPQAAKDYILSGSAKAIEPNSNTRFRFEFLTSPTHIFGNNQGRVCGLEVEDNSLVLKDGDTKARSLGTKRVIGVDSVIYCIGDRVDDHFGLPIQWNEYVKNTNPTFPVEGLSYEAYDPQAGKPIEGVFVVGWSREASSGLVGLARKDGENGAKAALQYLEQLAAAPDRQVALTKFNALLERTGKKIVTNAEIEKLDAVEQARALQLGLQTYKIATNEEMLAAIEE